MGTLRPAVVLYNEEHPNGESIGLAQATDIKKRPDLLIVMGTSLKIVALKKFIKQMAKSIHTNHPRTGCVIFVNKTKPTKEWDTVFDYQVMGDADAWVGLTEEKLMDAKALAAAKVRLRMAIKRQEEEELEDKENIDIISTTTTKGRKRELSASHITTTKISIKRSASVKASSSSSSKTTNSAIKKQPLMDSLDGWIGKTKKNGKTV
jgi:NAD-dependent histone deacetylase SIR2